MTSDEVNLLKECSRALESARILAASSDLMGTADYMRELNDRVKKIISDQLSISEKEAG